MGGSGGIAFYGERFENFMWIGSSMRRSRAGGGRAVDWVRGSATEDIEVLGDLEDFGQELGKDSIMACCRMGGEMDQ